MSVETVRSRIIFFCLNAAQSAAARRQQLIGIVLGWVGAGVVDARRQCRAHLRLCCDETSQGKVKARVRCEVRPRALVAQRLWEGTMQALYASLAPSLSSAWGGRVCGPVASRASGSTTASAARSRCGSVRAVTAATSIARTGVRKYGAVSRAGGPPRAINARVEEHGVTPPGNTPGGYAERRK